MTSGDADTTSKSDLNNKKRRREEGDEETDGLSKAERKRLKKLAKERPKDSGESEMKKHKRKEKKHKTKLVSPDPSASSTPVTTVVPSRSSTQPATDSAESYLTKHHITIDGHLDPITSFDQLSIHKSLRSSLDKFTQPTPIQACAWPVALAGKDVVGIAETGSGKTLGFALPALSRLTEGNHPSAISVLVLAPTRELAIQSHETFQTLAEPLGLASICLYGGVPKNEQRNLLRTLKRTLRIIVATPGRILDFLDEGVISLKDVSYLVLDEADRMLDDGFENDIRHIISQTMDGSRRQTLIATWPDSVRRLASTYLRDPVRITVGSDDLTANSRVEQVVEVLDGHQKEVRLLALLKTLGHVRSKESQKQSSRILVFCLYKAEAARVDAALRQQGYSVAALHGNMGQHAREKALQDFKDGVAGLLVATDVAARGLDIPNVSTVINYTFPLTIEAYIHRIGRTGRGGKSGKSHTFFTGDDHERALAGELMRVLRDSGFDCKELGEKFPMTVKKKEHSAYGAFYRDVGSAPEKGTKIKF
ncbi:RNA-dependent ATPase [Tulasnella sp. 403]|nr:RNA-dependent ATPase [Tulasnella sp. 403]